MNELLAFFLLHLYSFSRELGKACAGILGVPYAYDGLHTTDPGRNRELRALILKLLKDTEEHFSEESADWDVETWPSENSKYIEAMACFLGCKSVAVGAERSFRDNSGKHWTFVEFLAVPFMAWSDLDELEKRFVAANNIHKVIVDNSIRNSVQNVSVVAPTKSSPIIFECALVDSFLTKSMSFKGRGILSLKFEMACVATELSVFFSVDGMEVGCKELILPSLSVSTFVRCRWQFVTKAPKFDLTVAFSGQQLVLPLSLTVTGTFAMLVCGLCGERNKALQMCTNCNSVAYCSDDHRAKDESHCCGN